MSKLDPKEFHLLRLAGQGADADGWAPVSNLIWPLMTKLPEKLLEREWPDGAEKGRCRLTDVGKAVLEFGSSA